MTPRFPLRWFFVLFAIVGVVVAALQSPNEVWGAILLGLTIAVLVYATSVGFFRSNVFALGVPIGFVGYVSLGSTSFAILNPVCDWLMQVNANAMLVHVVHLMVGWGVGIFAGLVAWVIERSVVAGRHSILCVLLCSGGVLFALGSLDDRNRLWGYAYFVASSLILIYAVSLALLRRDPFPLGLAVGFILYQVLNTYFSVLNPFAQLGTRTYLGARNISYMFMTALTVGWIVGILCGGVALAVAKGGSHRPAKLS